ncbi:MAG: hypothetical protein M9920_02115 [Verrucomicrobiae bacterium]|nr:hypothetical protein [Verrucomicrobiae bacterium]
MKKSYAFISSAGIGSGILALGLVLVVGPTSSKAATYSYGDFFGSSVIFQGVTESSITDVGPLFGAPILAGDTLDFNPQNFAAFSQGGGVDLTDGQLNFLIKATEGNSISQLRFYEAGDFSLAGTGTGNTKVAVATSFFFDILSVDGISINPISLTASMVFAPNANGQFDLISNSGIGLFWSGGINFDINAALDANSISYTSGATEVRVNLDNTLLAMSESGSVAYIAKKGFDGMGFTVSVPEPSSMTIALLGMLALFGCGKRKA